MFSSTAFSSPKPKQSLPRHHFSHRDSNITYYSYFQSLIKNKLNLRTITHEILSKPLIYFISLVSSLLILAWLFGLTSDGERRRGYGERVVARNWNALSTGTKGSVGIGLEGNLLGGGKKGGEMVLILCPMKNSIEHIWHFFSLLDSLNYPRHLIQIAILVSDSNDLTYSRALELADERQYTFGSKGIGGKGRYDRISVFNKDFRSKDEIIVGKGEVDEKKVEKIVDVKVEGNKIVEEEKKLNSVSSKEGLSNIGSSRHDFSLQIERRKLLAKSRSWLVESSLSPEIDFVLWLDVDVVEFDKNLIETLMGWSKKENVEVVVPNCMWKSYNEMGSYDRNNWAETPESLAMKATLKPSDVLIEGYTSLLETHRLNMADLYPLLPSTPETMILDGVGGCTALVKASIHREGAIFPAWNVDHQLETEGFAQIVKNLGGRCLGLTGYYVFHGLYG